MAWLRALLPRRKRRSELRDAAVRYARMGWLVAPGTYLLDDSRPHGRHAKADSGGSAPPRCSCRNSRCAAPGEHPAAPDWQIQATHDQGTVSSWWSGRELPNVILPTGWNFDVLRLPPLLGARLLAQFREALDHSPGPVARGQDGQWWFFAAPVVDADRPHAQWLASLRVGHHGVGDYMLAPPSTGGPGGGVGWVLPPTRQTRRLPSVETCARLLVPVVSPQHRATAPHPPELHESQRLQWGNQTATDAQQVRVRPAPRPAPPPHGHPPQARRRRTEPVPPRPRPG